MFKSRFKSRGRQQSNMQPLNYQALEPRQMLAAALHVDFGFGMSGDLTLSDSDSASLHGPQVFGAGHSIGSFTDFVTQQLNIDFNGDGTIDEADASAFADQVMADLQQIFIAFDVQLAQADAGQLDDISNSLAATDTNDAYIYVGQFRPDGYGIRDEFAITDTGNSQDNAGFVFMDNILANGESTMNEARGVSWTLARLIAKAAGHTFGLAATEGSLAAAANDVMALPGNDADGSVLVDQRDLQQHAFFNQAEMELRRVDGFSPGTQDAFDLLATNVGLREDAPGYLNFDGSVQHLVVNGKGPNYVSVTINGGRTAILDVSNGLFLATGSHGDSIQIHPAISTDVTLYTSHVIAAGGDNTWTVDGVHQGRLNDNISFFETSDLSGGAGVDSFNMNTGASMESLNGGGGDDLFIFQVDAVAGQTIGGDGNDFIKYFGGGSDSNIGGAGNDTIDYSDYEGEFQFLLLNGFHDDGFAQVVRDDDGNVVRIVHSAERFLAPEMGDYELQTQTLDQGAMMTYIVDGHRTIVEDKGTGARLVLFNFSSFELDSVMDSFYVRETAYPLTVDGADTVVISSDLNLAEGTTQTINHDLTLVNVNRTVISNRAGQGIVDGVVDDEKVSGVTNANVFYDGNLEIHGSDEADWFSVVSLDSDLKLFGFGGDDTFNFGGLHGQSGGDLAALEGYINVRGNEGDDRVLLDDTAGSFSYEYQINEQWVLNPETSLFLGVNFDATVETVEFEMSDESNLIRVMANPDTRFIIHGNDQGFEGDRLRLLTPTSDIQPGANPGDGIANYGEDYQPIEFTGFELIYQQALIATAAAGGSPPIVRAYDAQTQELQFELLAYPVSFEGGVNVATADLNFDGIDDLVVSPGPGRGPLVRVFDGADGSLITTFNAFASTYLGGVDVAIGNVMGDAMAEIVVSKLDDEGRVRVFRFDSETDQYVVASQFVANQGSGYGVTIDVGEMNFDGYLDVVTGAAGGSPIVSVFDVHDNDMAGSGVVTINRFLAEDANYTGGIHVAVVNVIGNSKGDILVSPFRGQLPNRFDGEVLLFNGQQIPRDNVLAPTTPVERLTLFGNDDAAISIVAKDLDGDGQRERFFAAIGNQSGSEIKELEFIEDQFQEIDSFIEQHEDLTMGIHLG